MDMRDWWNRGIHQERLLPVAAVSKWEKLRIRVRRYGDGIVLHAITAILSLTQLFAFSASRRVPVQPLWPRVFVLLNAAFMALIVFDLLIWTALVFLEFLAVPSLEDAMGGSSGDSPPHTHRLAAVSSSTSNSTLRREKPPLMSTVSALMGDRLMLGGTGYAPDFSTAWQPTYSAEPRNSDSNSGASVFTYKDQDGEDDWFIRSTTKVTDACLSIAKHSVHGAVFEMLLEVGGLLLALRKNCCGIVPLGVFRLLGYAVNPHRLPTSLRVFVGVNKRLWDRGGFVLDLSYVTNRLAAMGLPARGMEALYRNPIEELAAYLRVHHPSAHMVVNTCSERVYHGSYFHKVLVFPCNDHSVMPLHRIWTFCHLTQEFLDSCNAPHLKPIVVVHCLGGKGRTGLMICCWLLFRNICHTAVEAMLEYAKRRTDPVIRGRSLTLANPCQIRYLAYVAHITQVAVPRGMPRSVELRIVRIVVKFDGVNASQWAGRVAVCVAPLKLAEYSSLLNNSASTAPSSVVTDGSRRRHKPTTVHSSLRRDSATILGGTCTCSCIRQIGICKHRRNSAQMRQSENLLRISHDVARPSHVSATKSSTVTSVTHGSRIVQVLSSESALMDWRLGPHSNRAVPASILLQRMGDNVCRAPMQQNIVDKLDEEEVDDSYTFKPEYGEEGTLLKCLSNVTVTDDFFIELYNTSDHPELEHNTKSTVYRPRRTPLFAAGYAKLWLHASLLHVHLPSLSEFHRTWATTTCGHDSMFASETLSRLQKPLEISPPLICKYRGSPSGRIYVGFETRDFDFSTDQVRRTFLRNGKHRLNVTLALILDPVG